MFLLFLFFCEKWLILDNFLVHLEGSSSKSSALDGFRNSCLSFFGRLLEQRPSLLTVLLLAQRSIFFRWALHLFVLIFGPLELLLALRET